MMFRRRRAGVYLGLATALVSASASCAGGKPADWSFNNFSNGNAPVASDEFAWSEVPRASVLFVLDNATDSCGLQSALWRGVPSFLDALRTLAPDVELRVAVTTAEIPAPHTASGVLSSGPRADRADACDAFAHPDCDAVLDEAGRIDSIVTESTPAAARRLACLMDAGTGVTGDPFVAAAAALAPERLAGTDFIREGSLLAVIIISDRMSPEACDEPIPGASLFECQISLATALDAPARLARLAHSIPGVTDFYVARLPVPEAAAGGSGGVPSTSGPILSPGEGGLSPVCSIPTATGDPGDPTSTMVAPTCVDTLGPALFAVARDLSSSVVPGCLETPPCPGVGAGDIAVEVLPDGADMLPPPLSPFDDYQLVRDPSCTGGFRVDFSIDPMAGDQVTIDYPAGTAAACQ